MADTRAINLRLGDAVELHKGYLAHVTELEVRALTVSVVLLDANGLPCYRDLRWNTPVSVRDGERRYPK